MPKVFFGGLCATPIGTCASLCCQPSKDQSLILVEGTKFTKRTWLQHGSTARYLAVTRLMLTYKAAQWTVRA